MTRLRVLLVDDEPLALRRLLTLFADIDDTEIVGTAATGREAEAQIAALRPDLVMLDISMPQKSGLRVASDLASEERPEIVFVTAFEQYAPDAFEAEAADYLLKPVRFDRLRQAVERARRRRALRDAADKLAALPPADAGREDAIWVQVSNGQIRLPIDQIEWIEAAKDYVMLHSATRSYIHRISMTALEAAARWRRADPRASLHLHPAGAGRRGSAARQGSDRARDARRRRGAGRAQLCEGSARAAGPVARVRLIAVSDG